MASSKRPDRRVSRVLLRVPASTSNLGSGFDTLGLALNRYARFSFERSTRTEVRCRPGDLDPARLKPFVEATARQFFRSTGAKPQPFAITLDNKIPIERGLGFSAAIRIGLFCGLNLLFQQNLEMDRLLELAIGMEGHPDNVTPSALGGFTVSGHNGKQWKHIRFPASSRLEVVTLIPASGLSTKAARKLLPPRYSRENCAHALNRAAMVTAALARGDARLLAGFLDDRFHEPFRARVVKELRPAVRAGIRAGAIGGFLSGAGSAVICLSLGAAEKVGRAMCRQARGGRLLQLRPDNRGIQSRVVYE